MQSLERIVADNRLPSILGIDPATSCGWAVGDYGPGAAGLTASGTWDLSIGNRHPGDRFLALRAHAARVIETYRPVRLICYENPFHRGAAATASHHGLVATLQLIAAERGIEVLGVNTMTLKKHGGGHGRADKEVMVRNARAAFGRTPRTDDEADAMWLYDFAARTWGRGRRH
jgi:Holliday junction resolvasome RuvABC endonuclease subunit